MFLSWFSNNNPKAKDWIVERFQDTDFLDEHSISQLSTDDIKPFEVGS